MTRRWLKRRREFHRKGKRIKDLLLELAGRITWMFKVRDYHYVCLFCEYYRMCRKDGIPERR